jgi:hypothetical protein
MRGTVFLDFDVPLPDFASLLPRARARRTTGADHSSGGSVRTQAMMALRSWSVMRLK